MKTLLLTVALLGLLPGGSWAQAKKVLFVMSAARELPLQKDKVYRETGVFLNEFYLAYQAITAAGYAVDFASPHGSTPNIDRESYHDKYWKGKEAAKAAAAAFVQQHPGFRRPRPLEELPVALTDYAGLVVPGGQGLMADLMQHPRVPELLRSAARQGKAVGLICHAPALLLTMPPATNPFVGYRVNAVSGLEEFYIERFVLKGRPANRQIGRQLRRLGLQYERRGPGQGYAVRDRELVTSQNPFSNDAFSRLYVAALADYQTRGSLRQPSALN